MTISVNIGGVQKTVTDPKCNIDGVWRNIVGGWTNIDGVWRRFYQRSMPLYTAGVENVPWSESYHVVASYDYEGFATLTKNSGYMTISTEGSEYTTETKTTRYASSEYCTTDNAIDVTSFSKLMVDFSGHIENNMGTEYGSFNIGLSSTRSASVELARVTYSQNGVNAPLDIPRTIVTVDISAVTGLVYPTFGGGSSATTIMTCNIFNMWLE